jgi:hypothetical protein
MKLQEAAARLQESLDAFDADVSDHLENDTERADLWHDMDANAEDIRTVLAALRAAAKVRANSEGDGEVEEEDLASDDRWNAGVNYAIERLCEILGVDPKAVNWDAATETLDGDVMSVICNVLVAAYGEEWSSSERDTAVIRLALASIPATGGEKV